jgi:hypothetical protein
LKSHMLISSPNEQYYYCRKLSPDSSKPYKPIDLFFQDFRSAPRNLSTPLRGNPFSPKLRRRRERGANSIFSLSASERKGPVSGRDREVSWARTKVLSYKSKAIFEREALSNIGLPYSAVRGLTSAPLTISHIEARYGSRLSLASP